MLPADRMLKFDRKKAGSAPRRDAKSASGNGAQGVEVQGNALRRICAAALLVALVPSLTGIGFLVLLYEPAAQQRRIEQSADSLAAQQAWGLHRFLDGVAARMHSAANSPPALSSIASGAGEEVALAERAMLDYFPEVAGLRIIPMGEMGTAGLRGGDEGLRNHIEVDLVRRAGEGASPRPESYRFGDRWLTSLAEQVTHPSIEGRRAVIIVTLDNDSLARQLQPGHGYGRSELEQPFTGSRGKGRTEVIAAAGSSGGASDYTRRAEVPDTPWQVAFTPSAAMVDALATDRRFLYGALAPCLLGAIAAVALVALRFRRVLGAEIGRMVAAAEKKSPLQLAIPELVGVARQLRRLSSRQQRRGIAPPAGEREEIGPAALSQGEELTNPMFQSTKILDEEVLELDLPEAGEPGEAAEGSSGLPEHVFRAYDIRGDAASELTDELLTRIGGAIGTIAGEMDEQTLIVGCDGRNSSPRIKSALIRSLMETGRDVVDIGQVPTPVLYFATRHLNCRSGVMITGSHNPGRDNGLKIVLNQQTIHAGGIRQIRDRVVAGGFSRGNGRMIREDVVPAYIEEVVQDIAISMPLKIVLDAGNGVTGAVAPELFEELGCEVVPLHCEVNGDFPNHPPDTSNEENLADLVKIVRKVGADLGVAFDGDGDRLAVVTGSGRIVRSDLLLMIFAQDVVSRNPGSDVVFDVKCSRHLTRLITQHGGRPVLWKTGHAFIKEKMAETGALLGGEFSGHMFFGERWYGFDDGMYAAGRLAEILSTLGENLDTVIDNFPATVNTPEILIPVPEGEKFALVQRIVEAADFPGGKINTMDGLRVDFNDGWGLLRASNTSPALKARFEADTGEALEGIKARFRALLARVEPALQPDF
jgi:phosphomannomutase/phosphoglucomutase